MMYTVYLSHVTTYCPFPGSIPPSSISLILLLISLTFLLLLRAAVVHPGPIHSIASAEGPAVFIFVINLSPSVNPLG